MLSVYIIVIIISLIIITVVVLGIIYRRKESYNMGYNACVNIYNSTKNASYLDSNTELYDMDPYYIEGFNDCVTIIKTNHPKYMFYKLD